MHEWQVASSPQSTEASWQHPWVPRATQRTPPLAGKDALLVNDAHVRFFFRGGKRVINPNDTSSSFSLSLFSHRGLFNTNQRLSLSAILITFPSFVSLPGHLCGSWWGWVLMKFRATQTNVLSQLLTTKLQTNFTPHVFVASRSFDNNLNPVLSLWWWCATLQGYIALCSPGCRSELSEQPWRSQYAACRHRYMASASCHTSGPSRFPPELPLANVLTTARPPST